MERPFVLNVVNCLRAMSLATHVNFELKDLNYDNFHIGIVLCIPTTFDVDFLFELPPLSIMTVNLIKCKEWIRNIMAMCHTRLRRLT
jgi:hypothetical protein